MLKINFFTPSFDKTGSEVALCNLIKYSADSFAMKVVSNKKGELRSELPTSVPFFDRGSDNSIFPNSGNKYIKLANKALKYLKLDEIYLEKFSKKHPADLWYINTISLPSVLSFAGENKIPFVLHVHELEQRFVNLSEKQMQDAVNYPSLIIACSNTCENVIRLGGRKNDIKVCYPGINFKNILIDQHRSHLVRKKFNVDDDAFLWIMSGTMDINKNPSLFVDIANNLLKKNHKAHFIWITNGHENNGYVRFCINKAVELGISEKIIWTSKLNDEYYDYFNAGDGFVLTSTRESFSMVTVEALYLNKPVVTFDCGGVNEIVNNTNGIIVNCRSIEAISDAMVKVMNKEFTFDPSSVRSSIERFDIQIQQQNWKQIINNRFS